MAVELRRADHRAEGIDPLANADVRGRGRDVVRDGRVDEGEDASGMQSAAFALGALLNWPLLILSLLRLLGLSVTLRLTLALRLATLRFLRLCLALAFRRLLPLGLPTLSLTLARLLAGLLTRTSSTGSTIPNPKKCAQTRLATLVAK